MDGAGAAWNCQQVGPSYCIVVHFFVIDRTSVFGVSFLVPGSSLDNCSEGVVSMIGLLNNRGNPSHESDVAHIHRNQRMAARE